MTALAYHSWAFSGCYVEIEPCVSDGSKLSFRLEVQRNFTPEQINHIVKALKNL